jgi:hypothetical protein
MVGIESLPGWWPSAAETWLPPWLTTTHDHDIRGGPAYGGPDTVTVTGASPPQLSVTSYADLGQSRAGSSDGIAYYLAVKPGCRSERLFGVLGSLVVKTSSGYRPALGLRYA